MLRYRIILERIMEFMTGLVFGILLGLLLAQPTLPEVKQSDNCTTDYVEDVKRITCVEK